jgi:hypothetical protein
LILPGIIAQRGGSRRKARIAVRHPVAWGNGLSIRLVCERRAMTLRLELTWVGGSASHYLAPGDPSEGA